MRLTIRNDSGSTREASIVRGAAPDQPAPNLSAGGVTAVKANSPPAAENDAKPVAGVGITFNRSPDGVFTVKRMAEDGAAKESGEIQV